MKTSSCKQKGRLLQQLVVKKILEHIPTLSINDVRSTSMGNQGVDVQLSEAAILKFPWAIECKNQEKLKQVYDMWYQTKSNCEAKPQFFLKPLLVLKMNREKPLVVLDLDDFFHILKAHI